MTTGTKSEDLRIPVTTSMGSSTTGLFSTKNWSGSDSPARSKTTYQKSFYWVKYTVPGKPGKYFPPKLEYRFVIDRKTGKQKRILFAKRARYLKPTPPKVKKKLRFVRVPNPKPRRTSLPEHPYSMTSVRYRDEIYQGSTLRWNFYPYIRLPFTYTQIQKFGGVSYVDTWDANADLALLGKLRTKVAGSDFNFAVFLAEGNEALRMIANAASRISKSLHYLLKGNLVKAVRALVDGPLLRGRLSPKKSVSANWLELQYGWLPLLKDAEAGAEFLSHMNSVPTTQSVRVTTRRDFLSTRNATPGGIRDVGFSAQRTRSIKAIISDVDRIALSGLTDPASVLWEKLPWSFVADWFIPIGNFLSARGLASAVTGTFVTTDVFRMKWQGCEVTDLYTSPDELELESPRLGYRIINLNRTVSSDLQVPMPAVKPLAQAASWKHAANAVALLTQRLR